MKEDDLAFLYYITPDVYRHLLDGEDDPKRWQIVKERIKFKTYLFGCDLRNYIKTILITFKDKYPKTVSLNLSMVGISIDKEYEDLPFRETKDISNIEFNYKLIIEDNEDEDDEYLDNLKIEFKEPQTSLNIWIEESLEGKRFNKNIDGEKNIYEVSESPILQIESTTTSLIIFIDKKTYIDYY